MIEPVFASQTIQSWEQFLDSLKDKKANWIFRGQPSDKKLRTSLERALIDYQIDLQEAPAIERNLIRDFRRKYIGSDHERVLKDTLYCLSLMRHHHAPIRLLDCNYSPYIAAFFALKDKIPSEKEQNIGDIPVIWCINKKWLTASLDRFPLTKELIPLRNGDSTRNDDSFKQLYMAKNPQPFVYAENPDILHERLIIQQGLFLCPGDVSKSFEENIKSLAHWTDPEHILKFKFILTKETHIEAIKELLSMNISYASLFPGLDGFAESYKQKILILKDIPEDELS